MTYYSRTQSPPTDVAVLQTSDGLKYWFVDYQPTIGLQSSVLTEDSSVSMHAYGGGGRENYGSYLFEYKGTRIGFVRHEFADGHPMPPKRRDEDIEEARQRHVSILRITAIGTPVSDPSRRYLKDENGNLIKSEQGGYVSDGSSSFRSTSVTGLDWAAYTKGKRDGFPSQARQDEMCAIWGDLFTGLMGRLSRLAPGAPKTRPDGKPYPELEMRFDDAVIKELRSGNLIRA